MNLRGKLSNGGKSRCVDFKAEAGCESNRAQHTQLVFTEAENWIANRADNSGFQVFLTADEVEDFVGDGIEHHAVDGEITAAHVFARIFAEADFIGMAAVGVADIRTEGRNFNRGG